MIRLGLRLTLSGGREVVARLAVIAVAVAIGVGMLLATLAGVNAVNAQNARFAWLETGVAPAPASAPGAGPAADPLWWSLRADYVRGELIGRVDVAATGPHAPVPPGIPALPGPGQFYSSPALAELLRAMPADQLADRFAGVEVGTIGPAALPSPDSLIAVVGHRVDDLATQPGARQVTSISATTPSRCGHACVLGVGIDANGIALVLSVVATALLFPVLVFIGGATRLSAARREQRFAAMRLVGATGRQVSVIAAVESGIAALAGVAAGFGVFFLLRPALAAIPFTGSSFYPGDLTPDLADVLLVVVGVPVAAALAALVALRRVRISPLGVTRRVTPRPPRARRLLPLLAGVAELAVVAAVGPPAGTGGQQAVYLSGILLIMAGLVVAGPWLTLVGSRLLARRASRPATLLAARRLADDPHAGFRAVSGLVLALFVGTSALAIISTIVATKAASAGDTALRGTLLVRLAERPAPVPTFPAETMTALTSIPGVTAVTVTHVRPGSGPDSPLPPEVVSCADLARTPAIGHCAAGADTAAMYSAAGSAVVDHTPLADREWPAAPLSTAQVRGLPVAAVLVGTDGSVAAVERARTVLETAFRTPWPPSTVAETVAEQNGLIDQYRRLADVVILASLPIAGCSLAVSVVGGLADRKRPFSLLRLTGAPLGTLRRVVGFETAAPLLISAVVSAGSGLLAAHLFLHAQLDETLRPPGVGYYLLVLGGLAASLAVIAATLPLLARLTGPEVARNG